MRILKILATALWISSFLLAAVVQPASASKGVPNSATFGYGAAIDISGEQPQEALSLAQAVDLDWVALSVDWQIIQPEDSISPDWSMLDVLVHQAAQHEISVLIQINNPPPWAVQTNGPDAVLTADFVESIAARYWPSIQAVELFAAPNTTAGWEADPNAAAYIQVLRTVKLRLQEKSCRLYLVTGGLSPLNSDDAGIQPEEYLSQLYGMGLAELTDLIGVTLEIDLPGTSSQDNYQPSAIHSIESLRKIILENNHTQGTLWITHMQVPSGTIMSSQNLFEQLCKQIRSHLYIGTLFLGSINSCENQVDGRNRFWWNMESQNSEFLSIIEMLVRNNNGSSPSVGT
jgi:hypothetical protein